MPTKIRSAAELASLTPTQVRVLEQIAAGATPTEAARALGIARTTCTGHLSSIKNKLGPSQAHWVHAAISSGQIQPPAPTTTAPELTEPEVRLLRAVARHSASEHIARAAELALADVRPQIEDLVRRADTKTPAHLVGLAHSWGLLAAPADSRTTTGSTATVREPS